MTHVLILDARFYEDIADELVKGAMAELDAASASYERHSVPGVLELPAALAMAVDRKGRDPYDAYVLLGCVIRGQTSHYDIVANESARAIMALAVERRLAVGNGVLTVENAEQAWERARNRNKGAAAARAALALATLRRELQADV